MPTSSILTQPGVISSPVTPGPVMSQGAGGLGLRDGSLFTPSSPIRRIP